MNEPVTNDDAQAPKVPATGEAVSGKGPEHAHQIDEKPIAEPVGEPNSPEHSSGQGKWRDSAVPAKKRPLNPAFFAVGAVILLILAAVGWKLTHQAPKTLVPAEGPVAAKVEAAKGPLAAYARGSIAHLVTFAQPKDIADIPFMDRDKKALKLSDFKGKVVVLNVWATWCAPCRFEMPTLAHLQTLYAGKALKVLPLSVDREQDFADVKSFIDVQQPLEVYADQNFQAPSKYGISGMPATLILDKQGRAVARLDGEATWDTPEVKALLDKLLSE